MTDIRATTFQRRGGSVEVVILDNLQEGVFRTSTAHSFDDRVHPRLPRAIARPPTLDEQAAVQLY
jgi:hypothetical protein